MQDEDRGGKKLVSYDTYAKLVDSQRRQLEREIHDESKALALTRRFLIESEQTQKSILLRQQELEQKLFERDVERWEKELGEEKLLKRIEKGEKAAVSETLINQTKQDKVQVANEKKRIDDARLLSDAKRAWWRKNMASVRVAEEQKRKEVADRLEDKKRKHEQLLVEMQEKLAEKKKVSDSAPSSVPEIEDVQEAIMPKDARRRVAPSPRIQRLIDREEARKEQEIERLKSPSRGEQRERKQLADQEKIGKLKDQLEKKKVGEQRRDQFLEEQLAQRLEMNTQREERRVKTATRHNQILREEFRAKQKQAEQKPATVPAREMGGTHCDAARKYLRIRTELCRRRDKMIATKRWKLDDLEGFTSPKGSPTSPKRTAQEESDGGENKQTEVGASRLQVMYEQYVKDKPIPRDAINYDRMHGARKRHVFGVAKLRCGLCEQPYVIDNLPGITTRATIGKLREKWRAQSDEAQIEERGKGLSGLYDKVALCALCFQFVQDNK